MQKLVYSIAGFCLLVFLSSCGSDDDYQPINATVAFEVPSNFPPLEYQNADNPLTEKGIELGRKLFYDGRLASDGLVACAFCHEQQFAFTHHGHNLSHGVDDQVGVRNTPALQNLAFQTSFFFDGAAENLEAVSIVPIHNPVEMNETLPSIVAKLQSDAAYRALFAQAFTDQKVSSTNLLKALAQFMTIMVSANSPYDKYVRNEGYQLSTLELSGKNIFMQKCASCHATDLFTDHSFRNNGLPINPNLNDLGRSLVTGSAADDFKFKVPSLRNVGVTAPYMHDGRFGSLASVLNFYSHGVQDSPTLDPILRGNGNNGIPLTEDEKTALIAFLHTLTDTAFLTNPVLSNQ